LIAFKDFGKTIKIGVLYCKFHSYGWESVANILDYTSS